MATDIVIPGVWVVIFLIAVVIGLWTVFCKLFLQPLVERALRKLFRVPPKADDHTILRK